MCCSIMCKIVNSNLALPADITLATARSCSCSELQTATSAFLSRQLLCGLLQLPVAGQLPGRCAACVEDGAHLVGCWRKLNRCDPLALHIVVF